MDKVIKVDRIIVFEEVGLPEEKALEYMSPTGDLDHPAMCYVNKNTDTGEITNLSATQIIEIKNNTHA